MYARERNVKFGPTRSEQYTAKHEAHKEHENECENLGGRHPLDAVLAVHVEQRGYRGEGALLREIGAVGALAENAAYTMQ